jgi:hypothetical protein
VTSGSEPAYGLLASFASWGGLSDARNPASPKAPGFSQRVSADGGFPGSSPGRAAWGFNPRGERVFRLALE